MSVTLADASDIGACTESTSVALQPESHVVAVSAPSDVANRL